MKLICWTIFFGLFLFCFSCEEVPKGETQDIKEEEGQDSILEEEESINYSLKRIREDSCFCETDTIKHAYTLGDEAWHWSREIVLPLEGQLTEESHYVTSNDKFPEGRLFATTQDENIQQHLNVSLSIYRDFDPTVTAEELYGRFWQREWTPAERGKIGQGSVGDIQVEELNPAMELWLINMMWADGERPEIGTKFLLEANGRAVVVVAGFETGPRDEMYIGGVTPEVHHWLGTNRSSNIEVSYLKNQRFPYGPVNCLGRE